MRSETSRPVFFISIYIFSSCRLFFGKQKSRPYFHFISGHKVGFILTVCNYASSASSRWSMRLEVALLSIPFAFCLSLFALRASIATRSSKGVSLSLRTIVYPFFICKSSLSFFLSILYQKSRDFSNVRLSREFKTCINEKTSTFQQKISTLKKALKNTKSP